MKYVQIKDGQIICASDSWFEGCVCASQEYTVAFDGIIVPVPLTTTADYVQKEREYSDAQSLDELRHQRSIQCFEVINRGQMWYDTLTMDQKAELFHWYKAWLDVTKTLEAPTTPNWLK